MLLPLDLDKIEFEKKFGGYTKDSVDDQFEAIRSAYVNLYNENLAQKDKIAMLNDLVAKYKSMEDSMNSALMLAQNTADELLANANKKAELIIAEAENKKSLILQKAQDDLKGTYAKTDEVKSNLTVFAAKNISLLKTQIEILNNMIGDNADFFINKE